MAKKFIIVFLFAYLIAGAITEENDGGEDEKQDGDGTDQPDDTDQATRSVDVTSIARRGAWFEPDTSEKNSEAGAENDEAVSDDQKQRGRPYFGFHGKFITRVFKSHYSHVVVARGGIRVKVVVDEKERVTIAGPERRHFNEIRTIVKDDTLFVFPSEKLNSHELDEINIVVFINSRKNVISVTAHSQGIVTSVEATDEIARKYHVYLYLYPTAQILYANVNVFRLNTYIYGAGVIFASGHANIHYIFEHGSGYIACPYLITRETELDVWDASYVRITALKSIEGKAGGASNIFYSYPPRPYIKVHKAPGSVIRFVATRV